MVGYMDTNEGIVGAMEAQKERPTLLVYDSTAEGGKIIVDGMDFSTMFGKFKIAIEVEDGRVPCFSFFGGDGKGIVK